MFASSYARYFVVLLAGAKGGNGKPLYCQLESLNYVIAFLGGPKFPAMKNAFSAIYYSYYFILTTFAGAQKTVEECCYAATSRSSENSDLKINKYINSPRLHESSNPDSTRICLQCERP